MSHGEAGIYGDESYPFCMNEAKNTVWLHELICKNPSWCTKKPARELAGKGGYREVIRRGLTINLCAAAPQTGIAWVLHANDAVMTRAHFFRFLRQLARRVIE